MTTDHVKLGSATPIFRVLDMPQALDWYRRGLGFQIAWTWGKPVDHAAVCRDSAEIMLAVEPGGQFAISRVTFEAHGVDTYYESVRAAGGQIGIAIADRPYGMRDFRVLDPFGNEISFGQPIE